MDKLIWQQAIAAIVLVGATSTIAIRVFSVPWNGKFEQWVAVVGIVIMAASALTVVFLLIQTAWRREILVDRLGSVSKPYVMSWGFWIAIALVAYLSIHLPH